MDNNLPEQQNLGRLELIMVVLRPKSQDLEDLAELVPELEQLLPSLQPGTAT